MLSIVLGRCDQKLATEVLVPLLSFSILLPLVLRVPRHLGLRDGDGGAVGGDEAAGRRGRGRCGARHRPAGPRHQLGPEVPGHGAVDGETNAGVAAEQQRGHVVHDERPERVHVAVCLYGLLVVSHGDALLDVEEEAQRVARRE